MLRPELGGIEQWDHAISREQLQAVGMEDRPLWRLLQSGQYHTAVRAARLGLFEDDLCFICGRAKQTWTILWAECPGLLEARKCFGPSRH